MGVGGMDGMCANGAGTRRAVSCPSIAPVLCLCLCVCARLLCCTPLRRCEMVLCYREVPHDRTCTHKREMDVHCRRSARFT